MGTTQNTRGEYAAGESPKEQVSNWVAVVAAHIKDATDLDVSTYTGNVAGLFKSSGESFKFDMETFVKAMNPSTTGEKPVSLVAHTHIEIDQDQMLFVAAGLDDEQAKLLEMHREAVKAATEARVAFVKAIAEMIHLKL